MPTPCEIVNFRYRGEWKHENHWIVFGENEREAISCFAPLNWGGSVVELFHKLSDSPSASISTKGMRFLAGGELNRDDVSIASALRRIREIGAWSVATLSWTLDAYGNPKNPRQYITLRKAIRDRRSRARILLLLEGELRKSGNLITSKSREALDRLKDRPGRYVSLISSGREFCFISNPQKQLLRVFILE